MIEPPKRHAHDVRRQKVRCTVFCAPFGGACNAHGVLAVLQCILKLLADTVSAVFLGPVESLVCRFENSLMA